MTFISTLVQSLRSALHKVGIDQADFPLQVTAAQDLRHGDYQTNVALILAKRLKTNPREFAATLVDALDVDDLAECEIAGPGFINFRLKNEAWSHKIAEVLKDDRFGVEKVSNAKTLVVDFS